MPTHVSGLMVSHPRVGIVIVINQAHPTVRQRFSWCHEYCHVLLDRDSRGMVSRVSGRDDLREVRANSFAANFLIPEEGVRQFVGSLGKGAMSRIHADVYDGTDVVPVDSRTEPGMQEIQLYDVVQLSDYFGVSPLSALYRLLNLKLINEPEFTHLKKMDQEGNSQRLAKLLALARPSLLSGLILDNGFPAATHLIENDIRSRLPFERLGFVVPVGQPLVDRAFQFIDAMEGPPADHAICDKTE